MNNKQPTIKYEVVKMKYDTSRPWCVLTHIRSYNKVMGRYETEKQAKRRAADLNRS